MKGARLDTNEEVGSGFVIFGMNEGGTGERPDPEVSAELDRGNSGTRPNNRMH